MKRNIIILFLLTFISACSATPPTEYINDSNELLEEELNDGNDLVDSEWVLTSLNGEPLLEGTNITLAFYPAEISGFAGCNGYGGPIEFHEKDEINVVEIASQAEGCMEPEGVLEQESEYLNTLWNIGEYRVDDNVLTLTNPDREQTLVYSLREKFETVPSLLENTHWNLLQSESFPLIDGSIITISFSNREIEGYGGCRDYKGEYEAEGDKIVFPVMMMLGEICDDLDLQIQESKFTTWLELSTHYRIHGDQLELNLATGEWLLFDRME
jgi:heat shock protein HslJ